MFRRRPKFVRVHHTQLHESFEGLWLGMVSGHYRIKPTSLIGNERAVPQPLGEVLVPKDKVSFMQVIDEDGR